MKIIRLENGSLLELASLLEELTHDKSVKVPAGSAILLGSASYLAEVGLQHYCEEFIRVRRRLLELTEGGGVVLPCPMLLMCGTDDPSLIRSIIELSSWFSSVLGEELCFVADALKESSRLLADGHEKTYSHPYRVMLPVDFSSDLKTKWECVGLNLPGGSPPISPEAEEVVIKILVGLLSNRLGLRLDCCSILNREVVHSAHGENRIVIVGSSHADRTGDALIRKGGFTVKKVIMPAWRAIKAKIPPMLEWLKMAMVDKPEDSLVVFQLLNSSLFLARTDDGGLSPAKRGQDGIYHVEGESTLAPKDFQYGVFQMKKPLIDAVGNRNVVIISPIPRFLMRACCDNDNHIPNIRSPDYRRFLEDAIFDCRKNLKDFAFRLGMRRVKILGPWNAIRRLGDGIWVGDPVHPSADAYDCIAESLVELNRSYSPSAKPHHQQQFGRGRGQQLRRGRFDPSSRTPYQSGRKY